jgi:homogentisate phytyltransferase/homogentisate geranylgeranyltransferase
MYPFTQGSSPAKWAQTLWRFSRPHTILATCLQVVLGLAFTIQEISVADPLTMAFQLCVMLVAGLGLNIYVVGINQITDVDIDRINKPELPIPAGDLTSRQASWIIAVGAALAILLGGYLGLSWVMGIVVILVLGSLYSCKPLRLKRFAVWSGVTIAVCRGVVFNLTTFLAWHELYGITVRDWTPIAALCLFMFAFVLAIGIFKDLPDTEGDRTHKMLTYAVRFGAKRSFWAGVVLLCSAYVAVIGANFLELGMHRNMVFSVTMSVCLGVLVLAASMIGKLNQVSLARFYRLIWVLFYVGLGSFSAYALLTSVALATP